ncbi:MAG: hypothetical protein ACAH89_08385 [Rariglobus sp.]
MPLGTLLDRSISGFGRYAATDEAMKRWGMLRLMKWGKAYNKFRHGARGRRHHKAWLHEVETLLKENAAAYTPPKLRMQDGWAIDTSMTLPHLDRLLEESGRVIRAKGGREFYGQQYSFMRSLLFPEDLKNNPSYLDFITSSELLAVVMDYIGTVPRLSPAQPPGVRFMESNLSLDDEPHLAPRASQLYHIDFYDSPQVYVLVALEDITPECGPWTFLPASVTDRIAKEIGYREPGYGYRVKDAVIRPLIRDGEEIAFTVPKGGVLFIDSSRCFHFGSRNSTTPRFMMMYGLQSPVRCDFAAAFTAHQKNPIMPGASRLRRMVLE